MLSSLCTGAYILLLKKKSGLCTNLAVFLCLVFTKEDSHALYSKHVGKKYIKDCEVI